MLMAIIIVKPCVIIFSFFLISIEAVENKFNQILV